MSGESTGPPIPLTSTGPFAPLNDLSDDEFLELMRVGNDLQAARMGLLLSERPARQEKVQDLVALEDLEGQIDAALGRLSNSGPLLSTILTKIGDNGVNA
jgi:hypothetical protein